MAVLSDFQCGLPTERMIKVSVRLERVESGWEGPDAKSVEKMSWNTLN